MNLRIILSYILIFGITLSGYGKIGRVVVPFDADWLFARFGEQSDGSYKDEPRQLPLLYAFDDSGWRKLNLPHDWGIEGPFRNDLEGFTGKLPWKGIGWYRKHFYMNEEDKGKKVYLDFDGAMANAEVWLNGNKVGEWAYGYTSFRVDLTPFLYYDKENVVAVRLNTEKWGSRWYPGGGIYRHVRMVKTSQIHVGQWGVFVTTPQITDEVGVVKMNLSFVNNKQNWEYFSYSVSIYERTSDGKLGRRVAESRQLKELEAASETTVTDSVSLQVANPKLWSLETPHLYVACVSVYKGNRMLDTYNQPFGFRTIAFTHNDGFLLNGRKVRINGVCMHHDLGALGAAFNLSALRRQLTILKDMGCNAIRTSHNPPAPQLLDLTDEMGFLVLDEAFDTWTVGKKENDYASLFEKWHERDIQALVCRDRNHPSVIMWSTGNEVNEQYHPEKGMARYLTELVHRWDATRPVSFGASAPNISALNGTEMQVDVHGMNYPAGVYGGPHFYGEFLNKPGHEKIVGYASETSSTMSSRGEYFPKRFHVSSYDLQEPGWGGLPDQEFAALDRYPAICGEFVWTGFDYLGEPTPFNSDASVLLNHTAKLSKEELEREKQKLDSIEAHRPTSRSSYFGIVDLAGFPKDRYYLYQSRWRPDFPMVHILPHWNFPDRIGQITPVFVYTSGDEAELFLNGKSLGRKKKGQYQYRLRWDDVVYQPGELKAVAYKDGKKWAENRVVTTDVPFALKLEADKSTVEEGGEDLMFVKVSVVDKNGHLVPVADNVITCSVEGGGEIIATDNGDPTSHIIFSEKTRPAFHGLFLAIVSVERKGDAPVVFKARAKGLKPAELVISVK